MRQSVGRRRSLTDIIRMRRSHLMDEEEEQRSRGVGWMPMPSRLPAPVGWKPPARGERTVRGGGQTARAGGGQTARAGGGQTARGGGGQTARDRLAQRKNQAVRPDQMQAVHGGGDTSRERPPTHRTLGATREASREEASLRSLGAGQLGAAIEEAEEEEAQPKAEAPRVRVPETAEALHEDQDVVTVSVDPNPPSRSQQLNSHQRDSAAEMAEAGLNQLDSWADRSFMNNLERASCGPEPDDAAFLPLSRATKRESYHV